MIIKKGDLAESVRMADEMAEQYRLYALNSADRRKSIMDLAWLCGEYLGRPTAVRVQKISSMRTIRGFFLRYPDRYEVVVIDHPKNNYCWQRFILCKELFHVVLDDEGSRNMNINEHIEEAVVSFPVVDASAPVPSKSVVSERLAEVAAMQFLYPYRDRVLHLAAGNTNYLEIAEAYKVPRIFVEAYLSEPRMAVFREIHRQAGTLG